MMNFLKMLQIKTKNSFLYVSEYVGWDLTQQNSLYGQRKGFFRRMQSSPKKVVSSQHP